MEATLLNYLWPLFLMILTAAAERKPLNAYHKAAACLGFAGVVIMLNGRGLAFTGFQLCFGHLWALISAMTWSVFSVTCSRHYNASLFSIVFLFSALLDFSIWLLFGEAHPRPRKDW